MIEEHRGRKDTQRGLGRKCLFLLSNFSRKFEIFHKNVITAIPATNGQRRRERRGERRRKKERSRNKRRQPKNGRGRANILQRRRLSSLEFMDFL